MRYFQVCEPSEEDPSVPVFLTYSEDNIREEYYPYWQSEMEKKFGPGTYPFEDCLEEWIVVNWAVEVKQV